ALRLRGRAGAAGAVDARGVGARRLPCASSADTAMVSATVSSGDGLFAPLGGMLLMFAMVSARLRRCARGGRFDRCEAGQLANHFIARTKEFGRSLFQDQKLVDHAERVRPVRDDD